jgi:hypothetical protein
MIRLFISSISLIILLSCSDSNKNNTPNGSSDNTEFNQQSDEETNDLISETSTSQIIHGIKFQVNYYSAVDFLMKAGRKIDADGMEELKNESVIQLVFSDTATHKSIKNHKRFAFSDEELNGYLQQGILSDFTILQNRDTLFPSGSQTESIGNVFQNKINLILFFNNVDLKKGFKVQYNDKLFNAGLIRFNNVIK